MSDISREPKDIVVAGDVTMDWNIARREDYLGSGLVWNAGDYIRTYSKPGGAALLAALINAIAKRLKREGSAAHFEVHGIEPQRQVSPDDKQYHHSYAIWSLYKYDESSPEHKDVRVWRVKNYLGLHPCENIKEATAERWQRVAPHIPRSALIVLDDATMMLDDKHVGFRQQSEIWRAGLSFPDDQPIPWIILKMSRPIAEGELWDHLISENLSDRLIVVIPVNELRFKNTQISRELSWERTAQDLVWELRKNPDLVKLSQCAHVIVSFGTAGALLLSSANSEEGADEKSDTPKCTLFFDPRVIEEMWGQNHPGGVVGYTSCLVAGLAHQVMLSQDEPEISQGVQNGLRAIRKLHKEGYGKQEGDKPPGLDFPTDKIVSELIGQGKTDEGGDTREHKGSAKGKADFSEVSVKDPTHSLTGQDSQNRPDKEGRFWTILRDANKDLEPLAKDIVEHGTKKALVGVPLGEFGDLLTADRREIESYRSVSALIREYYSQERPERPLSIAVFGPPGSGKSFGISEVAKAVYKEIKKLTFNLSQFSDPKELLGALHQVRDEALTGSIPLVFWDEFDTALDDQPLGWLRYFLAPMQDGKFQDGQITHPIGRAIFVFAGGTSSSRREFELRLQSEKLTDVKGTDFISRLRGFIDIMGPNPVAAAQEDDPTYIIRRAILLRSLFERKAPYLFKWSDKKGDLRIDEGVLHAFLTISRYRHGARSMESIIEMSRLAKKSSFERSALPPEAQLDLHVDGRAFLSIVQQIKLFEDMARDIHAQFCESLEKQGYTPGEKTDPVAKTHSSLRRFEDLPKDEREQNLNQARDMQAKLSAIGCVMIPARGNEPLFEFSYKEVELMAEMEHERWMKEKLQNGWSYATETNKADDQLKHQDILHWRKLSKDERARKFSDEELARIGKGLLSEEAKEKDRSSVREIPHRLAKYGYTIDRAQGENEKDERRKQAPGPTLKIGVAGLREVAESDALDRAVASALDWIGQAFPGHQLAAISTLAEGAERLVIKHLLKRSGALGLAILPEAEEEYETKFNTQASKEEFRSLLKQADDVLNLPSGLPHGDAYATAVQHMLENSDVFIIIWDGEREQEGDQTSDIIAKARDRGLPIAWIHAGSEGPGADTATESRVKQTSLTLENFWRDGL